MLLISTVPVSVCNVTITATILILIVPTYDIRIRTRHFLCNPHLLKCLENARLAPVGTDGGDMEMWRSTMENKGSDGDGGHGGDGEEGTNGVSGN